jgi:hypothetical protein
LGGDWQACVDRLSHSAPSPKDLPFSKFLNTAQLTDPFFHWFNHPRTPTRTGGLDHTNYSHIDTFLTDALTIPSLIHNSEVLSSFPTPSDHLPIRLSLCPDQLPLPTTTIPPPPNTQPPRLKPFITKQQKTKFTAETQQIAITHRKEWETVRRGHHTPEKEQEHLGPILSSILQDLQNTAITHLGTVKPPSGTKPFRDLTSRKLRHDIQTVHRIQRQHHHTKSNDDRCRTRSNKRSIYSTKPPPSTSLLSPLNTPPAHTGTHGTAK